MVHHKLSLESDSFTHNLNRRSVDSSASLLSFQWTLVGVSFLAVTSRLYARCLRNRNGGLDDVCIVIAEGLTIFDGICATFFTHYGIGKHVWQLDTTQQSRAGEWLFISILVSYIELFFIRLSIGIFVLRMFHKTIVKMRIAVYTILALNLANTIMVVVVYAIWCRPLQGVWNKDIEASCLSGNVLDGANRAFSVISACIDVMLCCLPISIIWRLQLDSRTKINITVLLLFGVVSCVCAILKAVYVDEASTDWSTANVPASYCAVAEENVGIIVACLPAVRQFYFITRDDVLKMMGKEPRSRHAKSTRPQPTKMTNRNSGFHPPIPFSDALLDDSDSGIRADHDTIRGELHAVDDRCQF